MNALKGEISAIEVHGKLSLVSINLGVTTFKSIVIETPDTAGYLQEGKSITVLFKETEVVIGRQGKQQISLQNRLDCEITSLEKGELLSKLRLKRQDLEITSVITTNAVNQLNLSEGSQVTAMVKTNEVMLSE